MAEALCSVPDDFHRVLHAAGLRIVIGDRLVNMDPAVRRQPAPRAWRGRYVGSINGAFVPPPVSRVYIAELINRRGVIAPAPNTLAVAREELGHALDYALDHGAGRPSPTDPDFLAAYNTDVARLTDPARLAKMAYFLQPGGAGREELFPGCSSPWGRASGRESAHRLLAAFPQCWNVMPRILP